MKNWMRTFKIKTVDLQTRWMVLQEKLNGIPSEEGRQLRQDSQEPNDTGGGLEGIQSGSQDDQVGAGNQNPNPI